MTVLDLARCYDSHSKTVLYPRGPSLIEIIRQIPAKNNWGGHGIFTQDYIIFGEDGVDFLRPDLKRMNSRQLRECLGE